MLQPTIDWLAALNLLGVAQGVFLAIIFCTLTQGPILANRILGALLAATAFIVLEVFLGYTGYIRYVPALVNVEEPFGFLIGPLTFLYTLALTQAQFRFNWKKFGWHFLPFGLQALGRLPFYLQSSHYKLQDTAGSFHQPVHGWLPARKILWYPEYNFLVSTWLDVATFGSMLVYYVLSFYLIKRYTQQKKESLWSPKEPSLRWLTRTLLLFAVFLLLAIFFSFTSDDDLGDIYIATGCSVIYYTLTFYLISHLQQPVTLSDGQRKKYEKSSLDEEMTHDIKRKLTECMESGKLYLNNELTLPQLAERVRVSTHHLSRVINEQFGQNFADFVNQYRVEEIKRRLLDPQYAHLKIEEIAYQSGFSTKSTFGSAFKKFTGMTPSEYRKKATERIITEG